MNGSVLAFVGDAVLTLQVREYLVSQQLFVADKLQKKTALFVAAMTQAKVMKVFLDEGLLSEAELAIYRRGVNYKNRSIAKNADIKSYKMATGLEALWGHWHLTGQFNRLRQMWEKYRTLVEG